MNAKFEKWFKDHYGEDELVYGPCGDAWHDSRKDAIQSLEVTPELRQIAEDAFRSSDSESWSGWLNNSLAAVFNAIKEQAK